MSTRIFHYQIKDGRLLKDDFVLNCSANPTRFVRFNKEYCNLYVSSFFSDEHIASFMRKIMAEEKPGAYEVNEGVTALGLCLLFKDTDGSFVNPNKGNCHFVIDGKELRGSLLRIEGGNAVVVERGASSSSCIPLSDILKFAE